jgi:hypothetical protein
MWGHRYWGRRHWGPRYWGPKIVGAVVQVVTSGGLRRKDLPLPYFKRVDEYPRPLPVAQSIELYSLASLRVHAFSRIEVGHSPPAEPRELHPEAHAREVSEAFELVDLVDRLDALDRERNKEPA